MQFSAAKDITRFFIVGINYKKTDATVRGLFAINNDQYEQMIAAAPGFQINEFFVLSTCNRTEVYGFAESAGQLIELLCTYTEGAKDQFLSLAYIKSGNEALEHLFHVAAGLDSQILGDYEIVGQIKLAAKFSKDRNFIGAYIERLLNEVLKASKNIRTNTAMSGGTVSVSFAAIQYIREKFPVIAGKKILMLGIGKIGTNTCKNLADYLPGADVLLINRTAEKAKELADRFQFRYDVIENLEACIKASDIILVATNAAEPVVLKEHFTFSKEQLVIDLSVPCNVQQEVSEYANITLVNVDELSRIKDETLAKRCAEIPKVKSIIAAHVHDFLQWHEMRRHVTVLKKVKNTLLTIQVDDILHPATYAVCSKGNEKVQKIINGMAVKMRTSHQPGCHYIQAINDFISTARDN